MSTIKISDLTSSGAIVGNVLVPVVGNVAGTPTTLKGTVDQLKTFIVASAEANIIAANIATIFANTNMKSYVDGQITAANAGVTTANVGIIGYVGLANTIQSAQIASANLGIIGYVDNTVSTANVGVKGYVDNAVLTANLGVKGYVDNAVSTANVGVKGYIDNAVLTANVGIKGYVDSQTYSNVQVATYLPTYNGNVAGLTVTSDLLVVGNTFVGNTYVPTANNSSGIRGQIAWDNGYVYICVDSNTWKRANISTW